MEYLGGYNNKHEIVSLWQICFGDNEEYINQFLQGCCKPQYCYGAVEGNRLVSMLFMLPITLVSQEKYRGRYVYAVATHPNYRGKGISKELLAYALEDIKLQGEEFSLLVPASESLYNFYSKQGYETCFYLLEIPLILNEEFTDIINLEKEPIYNLKHIRDSFFSNAEFYGQWEEDYLEYIEKECRFLGGATLYCKDGYLVCYPVGDTLYIKELVCEKYYINKLAYSAMKYFKLNKAHIRYIANKNEKNATPQGMIKWMNKEHLNKESCFYPYISLVLD